MPLLLKEAPCQKRQWDRLLIDLASCPLGCRVLSLPKHLAIGAKLWRNVLSHGTKEIEGGDTSPFLLAGPCPLCQPYSSIVQILSLSAPN